MSTVEWPDEGKEELNKYVKINKQMMVLLQHGGNLGLQLTVHVCFMRRINSTKRYKNRHVKLLLRSTLIMVIISEQSCLSTYLVKRVYTLTHKVLLTLILLTWTIWRSPTNASKWRMEFNSALKGLQICGMAGYFFYARFDTSVYTSLLNLLKPRPQESWIKTGLK